MRESDTCSPALQRATLTLTTAVYDRRALDSRAIIPLLNSLSHLSLLASTSSRVREILVQDGGIERLVTILSTKTAGAPDREGWIWTLAFHCLAHVGVRGTETMRARVVEAGTISIVISILGGWLRQKDDYYGIGMLDRWMGDIQGVPMRREIRNGNGDGDGDGGRTAISPLAQPLPFLRPAGYPPGRRLSGDMASSVGLEEGFPTVRALTPALDSNSSSSSPLMESRRYEEVAPRTSLDSVEDAIGVDAIGVGAHRPRLRNLPKDVEQVVYEHMANRKIVRTTGFNDGCQMFEYIDPGIPLNYAVRMIRVKIPLKNVIIQPLLMGSLRPSWNGKSSLWSAEYSGDDVYDVDARVVRQYPRFPQSEDYWYGVPIPCPVVVARVFSSTPSSFPNCVANVLPRLPEIPRPVSPPAVPETRWQLKRVYDQAQKQQRKEAEKMKKKAKYTDSDCLLSLQLLAYLSKYPHLRRRLRTDNEPLDVFGLVERFCTRHYPPELQYWAGIVMRNACRKDEMPGADDDPNSSLRYCARISCKRRETRPREFARCRRCRRAKYCSKDCQSKAWSEGHKYWCVERSAPTSAGESSVPETLSARRDEERAERAGGPVPTSLSSSTLLTEEGLVVES